MEQTHSRDEVEAAVGHQCRLGWDDGLLAQGYACQYVRPSPSASRVRLIGVRGLAFSHPFSGAFLAILFGVFVLPERTVLDSSGSLPYWVLAWLDSGCSSCVSLVTFGTFHTYPCEGVRRILRAILGQTYMFSTSSLS